MDSFASFSTPAFAPVVATATPTTVFGNLDIYHRLHGSPTVPQTGAVPQGDIICHDAKGRR